MNLNHSTQEYFHLVNPQPELVFSVDGSVTKLNKLNEQNKNKLHLHYFRSHQFVIRGGKVSKINLDFCYNDITPNSGLFWKLHFPLFQHKNRCILQAKMKDCYFIMFHYIFTHYHNVIIMTFNCLIPKLVEWQFIIYNSTMKTKSYLHFNFDRIQLSGFAGP